jgi:hypothetical protein
MFIKNPASKLSSAFTRKALPVESVRVVEAILLSEYEAAQANLQCERGRRADVLEDCIRAMQRLRRFS